MILSETILDQIQRRSIIGKMFSEARRLREAGKDPIDLMLGNPNQKPHASIYDAWRDVIADCEQEPLNPHRYIARNIGYRETRSMAAEYMQEKTGLNFNRDDIIMTAGCANAIDVALASFVQGKHNPLKDIIVFTPGFMEYLDYAKLNGATPITVELNAAWSIDYDALEAAITPQTRLLILNFPNNPTGSVLEDYEIQRLADFLETQNRKRDHELIVLEDSPYDQIVFDGFKPTSLINYYRHTIYMTSLSKTLSLASERIGFMAIHPEFGEEEEREAIRTLLGNNLRFRVISAPAMQQRLLTKVGIRPMVDVSAIERRVRRLESVLEECGYHFRRARGGFFVFAEIPKSFPDVATWQQAARSGNNPMLIVPGESCGGEPYRRYVRFAVTVTDETIARAERKIRQIALT